MSAALTQILYSIRSRPKESLVVFDLDSTLYDLSLRVTAILDVFAKDPRALLKFPEACQAIAKLEIRRTDWGIKEPLGRLGITLESHPDFVREIQAHWGRGFFSNDFLHHDVPLPGAVTFVQKIYDLGAEVLYLTGRDTPRMGDGTIATLKATGFPLDDRQARLHLKPQKEMDDELFKADVLAELAPKFEKIWFFENEPVNINAALARVPNLGIVFIDTCHSGLEDVHEAIARIPHFEVPLSDFE